MTPDPTRIIVRPASGPGDMVIVRRLFQAYLKALAIDLSFQDVNKELATLPGPYAEPHGTILLAERLGEPLGVVALKPLACDSDAACEMKRLYLVPAARGLGLADALCERAEQDARLRGYRLIRLDTLARLGPAIALYERRGYRTCAPYNDNPLSDVRYYEKPL